MERCDECGFVWELVAPAELPSRLAEAAARFRRLLVPPDRPAGWNVRAARRPGPQVWSAIEYAAHVRDVLLAQRERVYLALVEERPTVSSIHRDRRAELAGYADEDLAEVVAQLEVAATLLARAVARLDREQLTRTCVYNFPEPAVRTVAWVGAQAVHEAEHHALDVAAQLAPFELGLDLVRRAPVAVGRVELIVARPAAGERRILDVGRLRAVGGLEGDNWKDRPSRRTPDGSPSLDAQLNVMSARAAQLIAGGDRARWALAGDQLYVDLDISEAAVPPGTRLALGTAVIEVTAEPHRGCAKFSQRFGLDALRAVNSESGRQLRLRGLNARVVVDGEVEVGAEIRVLASR